MNLRDIASRIELPLSIILILTNFVHTFYVNNNLSTGTFVLFQRIVSAHGVDYTFVRSERPLVVVEGLLSPIPADCPLLHPSNYHALVLKALGVSSIFWVLYLMWRYQYSYWHEHICLPYHSNIIIRNWLSANMAILIFAHAHMPIFALLEIIVYSVIHASSFYGSFYHFCDRMIVINTRIAINVHN